MDIDGKNLKQISKEKQNLIHSPELESRWRIYRRDERNHVDPQYSGGRNLDLSSFGRCRSWNQKTCKGGKKEQKNIADPAFSPDGKYIYYTEDVTPGTTFDYNRDPLKSIFAITRYDLEDGKEERFISGVGGAIVATPSPDGKHVAFISRVLNKTALFIKDLKPGWKDRSISKWKETCRKVLVLKAITHILIGLPIQKTSSSGRAANFTNCL